MDSLWGRRSMHTLRKLPTARPRRANRNIKSISTGVYCGRIMCLKSIPAPMKSELLPSVAACVIIYGVVVTERPGDYKNRRGAICR